MKTALIILVSVLMMACTQPSPIKNQQDVIAQGYVAITVAANTIANAELTQTLTANDAHALKAQLQQAHDLLDLASSAPAGSDQAVNALTQAQAILNLARQYLINHTEKAP